MSGTTDQLLPCPFCGSAAEYYERSTDADYYYPGDDRWDIRCTNDDCYLATGADWYMAKEEVMALWNRRK